MNCGSSMSQFRQILQITKPRLHALLIPITRKTDTSLLQVCVCVFFYISIRILCNQYFLGPPSNPLPRLGYNNHNHSLTLNWNEPFTHPGFNVIRYTLEILNTADHETISEPIDMQLRRVYMYTSILPVMCTELEYTVTAYNEVGNSTASVTGGFPIGDIKCCV